MLSRASLRTSQRGLSLVEVIVVTAVIAVGSAVAIPVTMRMVNDAKGDSAMVMTATFLETVRNRAVAERRNMQLTFNANNIVVERIEVPSGARTQIDSLQLESGERFDLADGVTQTVDGLATGGANPYFTGPVPVMFTSDGSLIDSQGDPTNAAIFVGKPGTADTQRAITIWGITGIVRSWKWRGTWRQ
jgi:prepilin-type N-terminal cleavage/methylation domain-containing protein